MSPVVARLEGVAVEVVADVDTRAGVAVLLPGSTRAGVLLEDGERDAGLPQSNTGKQSRLPAADDDHWELRAYRSPAGAGLAGSTPSSSISSNSSGR